MQTFDAENWFWKSGTSYTLKCHQSEAFADSRSKANWHLDTSDRSEFLSGKERLLTG